MNNNHNNYLVSNSQKLRKNMTKEEKHLWYDFLKKLDIGFKRQKIIGQYIVDFYCASENLVVEIDGSQHYDEHGIKNDTKRDKFLNSLGLKVLRYSNYDINTKFVSVCNDILKNIKTPHPSFSP